MSDKLRFSTDHDLQRAKDLEQEIEILRDDLDPREFKFATEYIKGSKPRECWRTVYGTKDGKSKDPATLERKNGHNVLKRPHVKLYVQAIREMIELGAVLSIQEKRANCAAIVRFDWSQIIKPDGSFDIAKARKLKGGVIKSIKRVERKTGKKGESVTTTEIELHNGLDAIQIDNALAGHDKPKKVEVGGDFAAQVLEALPPTTGIAHTKTKKS